MSVEEIVWAMNRVINEGLALHWGVFEWDIYKIKDACAVAEKPNLIKPILVTVPYSISTRLWIESSYPDKCEDLGLSVITHSPLNGGIWSAKYMTYMSANSRYILLAPRGSPLTAKTQKAMTQLITITNRHAMTVAELAIGYCLSNAKVTSIVMGASRANQIVNNLKAVASYNQINHVVKIEIDDIMAPVKLPLFVNELASLSL
ncbi:putative voltage-gated potassium channel subunit beta [Bidens hawaiensis]|uniref:putative voltage-gated potassium channel subunit beta n=1 Tax=Bidens hawaiensis TaxID=980011 RepID=UPI00404A8F59